MRKNLQPIFFNYFFTPPIIFVEFWIKIDTDSNLPQ